MGQRDERVASTRRVLNDYVTAIADLETAGCALQSATADHDRAVSNLAAAEESVRRAITVGRNMPERHVCASCGTIVRVRMKEGAPDDREVSIVTIDSCDE